MGASRGGDILGDRGVYIVGVAGCPGADGGSASDGSGEWSCCAAKGVGGCWRCIHNPSAGDTVVAVGRCARGGRQVSAVSRRDTAITTAAQAAWALEEERADVCKVVLTDVW